MIVPPSGAMVATAIMIVYHIVPNVHNGLGDGGLNDRLHLAWHMLHVSIKFQFKLIWPVP